MQRPASPPATVSAPFLSLDFLYVPTREPDRDIDYYTRVLGGAALFRAKAMGTEVTGIRLSRNGPLVLLAEHPKGELSVLVYRTSATSRTPSPSAWSAP